MLRRGATLEIEGRRYRLLDRSPRGRWRVTETCSRWVTEFPEWRLRHLITAGVAKSSDGFVALGEIMHTSLRILLVDKTRHRRMPVIRTSLDASSGQTVLVGVDTETANRNDDAPEL